jgi:predicted acetyltransferase
MEIKTTRVRNRWHKELTIDDKRVSWLNIIDHRIKIGSACLKIGGIAGVGTDTEHRNKGYARILLEDSLKFMENEKYAVSLLFGIHNMYHKFGYAPTGCNYKLTISARKAGELKSKYRIRDFQKKDAPEIIKIYNKNNINTLCSIVRDKKNWQKFSLSSGYNIPAMCKVILDSSGRITGSAVLDDSKKEVNVSEVGFKKKDIFSTLLNLFIKTAVKLHVENINILLPPDHPFAGFCYNYDCNFNTQFSKSGDCMMRIIDQDRLFKGLKPELEKRLKNSKFNGLRKTIKIKTDLSATILKLNKRKIDIDFRDTGADAVFKLPQYKLVQLVAGYRSIKNVLSDLRVKLAGDTEEVLNTLFPEGHPYIWRPDWF